MSPTEITLQPDTQPGFGNQSIPRLSYIQNQTIEDETFPVATGGNEPSEYSISPSLPAGLTFNPSTRVLSGTPTEPSPETPYTYTAVDADGDTVELTFTIMVSADAVPSFGGQTVTDRSYAENSAIASVTLPEATGGDAPLVYSISPPLPAGLAFDPSTRVLSGTPTAPSPATIYTYTATDADGDTAALTFTIIVAADAVPSFGNRSIADQSYIENTAITSVTLPEATGGDAPLVYSISPSLPAGLTFDRSTRVLSGTPTVPSRAATYTYTVTDADGDTNHLVFSIVVTADREEITEEEVVAITETVQAVAAVTVANVTANIGTRFSATGGGGAMSVGGATFNLESADAPSDRPFSVARDPDLFGAGSNRIDENRSLSVDDLLHSGAFELSLNAAQDGTPDGGASPQWTVWGRGDLQYFESQPERGPTYDGDMRAGYLGIDARLGDRWLAGLATSLTRAEADYETGDDDSGGDGRLQTTLRGVHPYLRYTPDAKSEFWTILGAGRGEIENERGGGGASETSDITLWMGAAGARRSLAPLNELDLALLGDLGFARVETDDGVQAIDGLTVDSWRARVGVEGSHTTSLSDAAALTSFVEIAGRYDGGEGEDEMGLEISPGLYLSDASTGLGIEVRGRALVLHSAENYRERGVSVTASLSPRSDGLGLSLSLSPRWGARTGEADTLWRDDTLEPIGSGAARQHDAMSLDARVGYGIRAVNGLLTPFGEIGVRDPDSGNVRIGARFSRQRSGPGALSLELSGEWRETPGNAPEHRVGVIGRLRF